MIHRLLLAGSMVHLVARPGVSPPAGDIPDWTGQPDQGFEGYRFVGWSLYDARHGDAQHGLGT